MVTPFLEGDGKPLGCILKVFKFQTPQFSAMNRASKEANLGCFEVKECGLSGRMEPHKWGELFSTTLGTQPR